MDIEALARRYEPRVARAILEAWEQLAGLVSAGEIADAMRLGVDAVIAVLERAGLPDQQMRQALEPLVAAMAATTKATTAGFRIVWNRPDEFGWRWVMRTADKHGWLRYNIDPEGRELLRETLRRAFMEGGHPYQTARTIRDSIGLNAQQQAALHRFGEGLAQQGIDGAAWDRAMARKEAQYLRLRARTIARTETIRAARQGQLEGWQQAASEGMLDADRTWRVWQASSGACSICADLNGKMIPLNSMWPSGEELSAHPNCRCTESLVFDVPEGDPNLLA